MKVKAKDHNQEVRTNQKSYCDRWAEQLWAREYQALQQVGDLVRFVNRKLEVLEPSMGEVKEIAQGLRQKLRAEARPADTPSRPSKNRMYK